MSRRLTGLGLLVCVASVCLSDGVAIAVRKSCNVFTLKTEASKEAWIRVVPGRGVSASSDVLAKRVVEFSAGKVVASPRVRASDPGLLGSIPGPRSLEVVVWSPSKRRSAIVRSGDQDSSSAVVFADDAGGLAVEFRLRGPSQIFGWLDDTHLVVLSMEPGSRSAESYRELDSARSWERPGLSYHLLELSDSEVTEKRALGPEGVALGEPLLIDRTQAIPALFFVALSSTTPQFGTISLWKMTASEVVDTGEPPRVKVDAGEIGYGIASIDGRSVVRVGRSGWSVWSLRDDLSGAVTPLSFLGSESGLDFRGWVSLSPDGRYAALGQRQSVVLWDRKTLKRREVFGLTDYFRTARFSMVWAHGGLLIFGERGAVFIDQKLFVHDLIRPQSAVTGFAVSGPDCYVDRNFRL